MRSMPMPPMPAASTRLSASKTCEDVHCQRRAPYTPAVMPVISPPTSKPYLSFALSEPVLAQAIRPASDPQAVLLV